MLSISIELDVGLRCHQSRLPPESTLLLAQRTCHRPENMDVDKEVELLVQEITRLGRQNAAGKVSYVVQRRR